MKIRTKILLLLMISLPLLAEGQEVTVKAEYPGVVRMGQQFSISWSVNSGSGNFTAPPLNDFYVLAGPQTSYSSNTQIINGKISRETSYSYVYYLQPKKEGKFVIQPATVSIKNKSYSSEPVEIEVLGGNAAQNSQSVNSGGSGNEDVRDTGEDLFVNLSLDKRQVYLGQAILATVKIYTKVNISGINEIKYPDFEGFLRTDLTTPPLTSLKQENVNGSIYGTGVIQQFLLYPQLTGEINIDPVQISVLVQQKSGQSDPFFGDFFSNFTTVPRVIESKPLIVRVDPLPGVQPQDFSGIVGRASLNAKLDRDTVNVDDAVNLNFTVSGSGNLKLANTPKLNVPTGIEVYDPEISDNLKNGINGTSGQKSFKFLLIPRQSGEFTIPPVTYSYFDLGSGRYEKLSTPELHFYARKTSQAGSGVTVYGGVSKEDVKYLGKDIRFIRTEPGVLRKAGNFIAAKRIFYSIYVFSAVAFLAILFVRREHIRRNSDLTAVRNRKAGKVAAKRLKEASMWLSDGSKDKFYEEVLKALWGYLSDKLNIPVSDLTRTSAVESLRTKGASEEEISNLTRVIDACEYTRFAPSSSDSEATTIYDGASRFIRYVENSMS